MSTTAASMTRAKVKNKPTWRSFVRRFTLVDEVGAEDRIDSTTACRVFTLIPCPISLLKFTSPLNCAEQQNHNYCTTKSAAGGRANAQRTQISVQYRRTNMPRYDPLRVMRRFVVRVHSAKFETAAIFNFPVRQHSLCNVSIRNIC
jgi:hypothetical protein